MVNPKEQILAEILEKEFQDLRLLVTERYRPPFDHSALDDRSLVLLAYIVRFGLYQHFTRLLTRMRFVPGPPIRDILNLATDRKIGTLKDLYARHRFTMKPAVIAEIMIFKVEEALIEGELARRLGLQSTVRARGRPRNEIKK